MVYHFHWTFGKGIGTGPGPGSSLIGVGADSDDIPPSSAPALFAERSLTADRLRLRPVVPFCAVFSMTASPARPRKVRGLPIAVASSSATPAVATGGAHGKFGSKRATPGN